MSRRGPRTSSSSTPSSSCWFRKAYSPVWWNRYPDVVPRGQCRLASQAAESLTDRNSLSPARPKSREGTLLLFQVPSQRPSLSHFCFPILLRSSARSQALGVGPSYMSCIMFWGLAGASQPHNVGYVWACCLGSRFLPTGDVYLRATNPSRHCAKMDSFLTLCLS